MRFLIPWALLLLAAAPAATLLLFGRLRRRERSVAAFPLLRELIDALPLLPRSWLRRRRAQALALIGALAAAGLAAGAPVLGNANDPPVRAVIVVDHLAPWRAADGAAGAWEATLAAAARTARLLRDDDRVLVVRSDTGVAGGGLLAPRRAAALIGKLRPSALPADAAATGDLLALLDLAHAPALGAIVTADPGRWREIARPLGARWRIVAANAPPPDVNHALLAVEVRPDLVRAGRMALFVRAGSFGPPGAPATEIRLSVRRDGQDLAERRFPLAPGRTHGESFPALDAGAGLLEVTLAPADAFMEDNRYEAPLRERAGVATLLVTEENPPLEAALRALPGLAVATARPGDAAGAAAAVRVFDNAAPAELAGNVLAITPPEGLPGIGYRGEAASPRVLRAVSAHFLLQGVSLAGLRVRRLPLYEIPTGMEVLATADGQPLIAAGRAPGGARLALLAFDPRESEWVHDPSFPILIANLAAWLAEEPGGTRTAFVVGDRLPAGIAASLRAVRDPAGRR
ncbi:MAG TPA: hypothetical protein VN317_01110, partial [Candidatus Methanoperedens sp.]|nr:hypothetical protein [Candidatus Methanoperedens sp.]